MHRPDVGSRIPRLLLILPLVFWSTIACAEGADPIRLDQAGYPTDGARTAVVGANPPGSGFTVHRLPENEAVFQGTLGPAVKVADSAETVRVADFSALTAPGTYVLRVEGVGKSVPFTIAERPYRDVLRLAMRSYYGQRCGMAVSLAPDHPTYRYPSCHAAAGFHTSSGRTSGNPPKGGWHDAGDFGRYVVNSSISVGTLLWAWELYPAALANLELAIPESDNAVPDFLDEVRWNLEWMLGMQDSDGGVWHKQTSTSFPGMVMPDQDRFTQYVIGTGATPFKSSCATADFAASMAIAARVYAPFDPTFAARTRDAAMSAWKWVSAHPSVAFRNPKDVSTGEYGDANCSDERLWAAAEIWRTTGDAAIGQWFVSHSAGAVDAIVSGDPPAWPNVGALAAWTYAMTGRGETALVESIRSRSVTAAGEIVKRAQRHGYRIPLEENDYVWGSNGVVANYALQLLVTDALQPDPSYRSAALDIAHYLFGRNAHGMSFVTGVGTSSPQQPHHRPSAGDTNAQPWPGLLVGGPNRFRQDRVTRSRRGGIPPAMMYFDTLDSYSTNEVAINWNAPLVFLLAGLQK
jgi:endoglucanase